MTNHNHHDIALAGPVDIMKALTRCFHELKGSSGIKQEQFKHLFARKLGFGSSGSFAKFMGNKKLAGYKKVNAYYCLQSYSDIISEILNVSPNKVVDVLDAEYFSKNKYQTFFVAFNGKIQEVGKAEDMLSYLVGSGSDSNVDIILVLAKSIADARGIALHRINQPASGLFFDSIFAKDYQSIYFSPVVGSKCTSDGLIFQSDNPMDLIININKNLHLPETMENFGLHRFTAAAYYEEQSADFLWKKQLYRLTYFIAIYDCYDKKIMDFQEMGSIAASGVLHPFNNLVLYCLENDGKVVVQHGLGDRFRALTLHDDIENYGLVKSLGDFAEEVGDDQLVYEFIKKGFGADRYSLGHYNFM